MKILKLALAILFLSSLPGCWFAHDSVTLWIDNNSSYDTTVNSDTLVISNVSLSPGQSEHATKTFYDTDCWVDFDYHNASFNESYSWSPPYGSWPGEWTLNVEITDAGVSFSGDGPSEWHQL